MTDNRLEIHYHVNDVTSVQRMRIFRSSQFKIIIGLWAVGVIFMALHIILPSVFQYLQGITWLIIGEMTLVYVSSVLALLYIAPWFSFQFTRFWRLPLIFQYNSKSIRLSIAGKKAAGLRLRWDEVRRLEENKRSFVIYYQDDTKHIIIPKSAFSERAEARFRDLAARGMAAGLAAKVAEVKSQEVEEEPEDDLQNDEQS